MTKRTHIRWWNAGIDKQTRETVWIGALSYDNGLTLTPYYGIITILHSVAPDVDTERDKLKTDVFRLSTHWNAESLKLADATAKNAKHDYYTDGNILVVSKQVLFDTFLAANTNSLSSLFDL